MSKKAKLEVVSTRAPRPSRYGPSQVVYDVIDANGGSATAKQVHELVPAAVDTNRVFTVEQIEAAFSNGVYRGYLTFNDTTSSYQIAPVSYYAARKSVVSEMEREARERRKNRGFKKPRKVADVPTPERSHWPAFSAGVLIGTAAGIWLGIVIYAS